MIALDADLLRRLLAANWFPTPSADQAELLFLGLRGCLPLDADDCSFGPRRAASLADVNYRNPRCTLVQWQLADDRIALFPGSTVPHLRYVEQALGKGGAGANEMMTGYYADYAKGIHHPLSDTAHAAFRQTRWRPVRRSSDDLDFDPEDRVEVANPSDNLHAAWGMGLSGSYSSAGCQVVLGYPRCVQRRDQPEVGPWKAFRERAYAARGQELFPYALLEGRALARLADSGANPVPRLRYGSQGDLVAEVQRALARRGFLRADPDGTFGAETLRAVLKLQEEAFGKGDADGIVGPITAQVLGVKWGATAPAAARRRRSPAPTPAARAVRPRGKAGAKRTPR